MYYKYLLFLTLEEGSALTLWCDSIFRRRGGIILTASCRLMLPCNDKQTNDARILIFLTTSTILFSLFFPTPYPGYIL